MSITGLAGLTCTEPVEKIVTTTYTSNDEVLLDDWAWHVVSH